jgi:hypothetical protein
MVNDEVGFYFAQEALSFCVVSLKNSGESSKWFAVPLVGLLWLRLSHETERGSSVFVQVLFVGALRFEAGVQIGGWFASLCV